MTLTTRSAAAALAAALGLGWASLAAAQDAPRDDALDRLLEKVEGPKSDDADAKKTEPGGAKPAAPASDDALDRLLEKVETEEKAAAKGDEKKGGAVKDDALDRLLEGIGETTDAPQAGGKPTGEARPGEKPEDAASLDEQQKRLDDRLEEILGRIKKKDKEEDQQQASGPLGEAIKKMDEVEKKLGEQDTGEQTRQEQKEIVKQLDQLIKLARAGGSKSRRPGSQQQVRQAGNQPGQQPGDNGNSAQGVGPQQPQKPDLAGMLSGMKDTWGNLPDQLRAEIENVFREEPLPARKALIDRYYLSIGKKSVAGQE